MAHKIVFDSRENTLIALLSIPSSGYKKGSVRLYIGNNLSAVISVDSPNGWKYDLEILSDHLYTLEAENAEIPYAYLYSDSRTILNTGVTFLDFSTGKTYSGKSIGKLYEEPSRNQIHFSTIRNWMNDPNGLCFYQGFYHMFYQMNPFSQKWGNTYWGHAVSNNLLSWRHMPIAMTPQDELMYDISHKGGAYSGSALVENGLIKLYLTRSFSRKIRDNTTKEYQAEAICDGIKTYNEQMIIEHSPGNPSYDFNFRDPMITFINGQKVLLIASTLNGICSVLVYKEIEGKWVYSGIMLQDPEATDCASFECANFIENQSGDSALIVSLQDKPGTNGKKRRMRAYIGRLDGFSLSVKKIQEIDFGTGSYAIQLFRHESEEIAFSWIVDTYNEFNPKLCSSNGAMSIPLICSVGSNGLRLSPHQALKELEENAVSSPASAPYIWRVRFLSNTDFRLVFAEDDSMHIGLQFNAGKLEFVYGNKDDKTKIELSTEIDLIEDLVIYVDKAVVHVFGNDGLIYGSKPYFIESPTRFATADFMDKSKVILNEIRMLKSIWEI